MRESRWLREIRTLDPERDCRRIVFLNTFHEFPFDTTPWLPKRLGARAISALLEEHVVEALDLVRPTRFERHAAEAALRLRSLVLRFLPARGQPHLRTTLRRRSYPAGYAIEELGPPA
jgi:hypothetical protein